MRGKLNIEKRNINKVLLVFWIQLRGVKNKQTKNTPGFEARMRYTFSVNNVYLSMVGKSIEHVVKSKRSKGYFKTS